MSWKQDFAHILRENEPLAPYTWLRVGGPARYFAEPTSVEELSLLLKRSAENNVLVRLLGAGSNLLVNDRGVDGLVIHLASAQFGEVQRQGNTLVSGGGAKLSHLVSIAAREGLAGLEDLAGIPGTVGGALHGNAGGQHGDIGAWTKSAVIMNRAGEMHTRSRREMNFSYRSSSLDELLILTAEFELEPSNPIEVTKRMQKNWIVKRAAIPPSNLSQGCLFKDHGGINAGDLIHQAGLKGAHVGNVQISEQYPNFVVIDPTGSAADVCELIDLISRTVKDRLGVELVPSLEIW
jgi:UDP-N-acetylmuramate dehydrogenase